MFKVDIPAAAIRELVLKFPAMEKLYEDTRKILFANGPKLFIKNYYRPAWYFYYELPYAEHARKIAELTKQTHLTEQIINAERKFEIANTIIQSELEHMDDFRDQELSEEEQLAMPAIFGLGLSLFLSLKCLLVYGCYLNDFVAAVKEENVGSDKLLFQAVKIDPTVICAPSIACRLSKAVMQNDTNFLNALRKAIDGKFKKREQRTYQNQRLVLQILHELDAPRLTDQDLYTLFVDQLNIVARDRDSDIGDVANNLRQFAYQFMKQKSVSENA